MKFTASFDDSLDFVDLVIEKDNGMVEQKRIVYEEFFNILSLATIETSNGVPVGRLPKGFYDGVIQGDALNFSLVVVLPAEVRPINYFGDLFMVPFPALAFQFTVDAGNLTVSKLYALDTSLPNPESVLYHYPFGNVYSDGKICWGMNVLNKLPSKQAIDTVVAAFFSAETNDDLYINSKYKTQRALIESLKGKQTFPRKLLTSCASDRCAGVCTMRMLVESCQL